MPQSQSQTRRATSDPELLELFRQVEALRHEVTDLQSERTQLQHDLARERERTTELAALHDDALVRAERALDDRLRVLGSVAHDLRTPIGAARMRVMLLLDGRGGSQLQTDARRHAEAIRRCLDRTSRLITDLLDVTALESGRFGIERRPAGVRGLLEDAVELARPLAVDAGVTLDSEFSGIEVQLPCDRDRVLQVLGNLIANALKFTGLGGSIVVSVRVESARVRFCVEDSGEGIDASDLPHVFEPYWRGKGERRGLGLGLCIAKGLVEAHGGRIEIESERGRGTRVFFTLSR